jgi:radical SAM superfamily enzyme YgiQ (UPF0313 family)
MNIFLIYPKFPETFWPFTYALSFIGKKAAFPPLGLLTVASLLPENWNRRLIDMNVESLNEKDLQWADMAFIGGMAVQRISARQVISRCNQSSLPVVAGGPLFTAEPEEFGDVDYLVLDEAEMTLPRFLADLESGTPQKVYRADGFCHMNDSPVPSWNLIKNKRYASLNLQFSRGCPFNCEFCNVTSLFGNRSRLKTPEQIILELDMIYQIGWRGSVFFVDDNFIGNKTFLKNRLLPELINWREGKEGIVFFTEASINLADDPALLDMMYRAAFDSVFIGIESPDEDCLAECHKTQNKNRDLLESVSTIHRSGMQVMGGFIVGFDSDTSSIFQRQIDFIQQSGIVSAMVGLLQAPPGTRLFDRMRRESRVIKGFSGDNVDGSTNIIPKMNMGTLQDGYRSIMKHIYSPKNYYRRIKVLLKELKTPLLSQPLDTQRFLSCFRSAFRLGVLGKERFYYWRLMVWTLTRRPKLMPVAITLSIYGYHYRRICELYIVNN